MNTRMMMAGVVLFLPSVLFADFVGNRALLVHPDEFTDKWIARATGLGVKTLSIHPVGGRKAFDSLTNLIDVCQTAEFRGLVDRAIESGLNVEYECHAGSWLLPREMFAEHPEYFRLDKDGRRTAERNFCVSNPAALQIVARRAKWLAKALYRSSHRYFFWLDDGEDGYCQCDRCKAYTPADQQMIALNAMLRAIREFEPDAKLAYLAFLDTMTPPSDVCPSEGIFLEYAPFKRVWDKPLSEQNVVRADDIARLLSCFGKKDARVLEYWFDNSLFCRWKKPERRFTPNSEVIRSDLDWYGSCGFEEIASFACYLGPEYERLWGEPDLSDFRPTGEVALRAFYGENGGRDKTSFRCGLAGSQVCFSFNVWDETVCAAPSGALERNLEDFDRVEIFFSPTADLAKVVCCVEIDPFGRVLDYTMRMGRPFNYAWHSRTLNVSARVVGGGYLVDGSIDAGELEEMGIDLKKFSIGAFRADYAAGGRLIEWYSARRPSGRPAKFHQPNMLLPAGFVR